MHHMDANEAAGEEAGRKLHMNVESSIKQVLATTPHETPTIRTLASHHENYTSQASGEVIRGYRVKAILLRTGTWRLAIGNLSIIPQIDFT